ncbi:MAG: ABC transporter ATP-binding protein [Alysiella sp.]|nr:ABC transporter ATP-binding protein [Alysiella sp.]
MAGAYTQPTSIIYAKPKPPENHNSRGNTLLSLHNIHKKLGQKTAAHDISFSAVSGSITAILGASGSGKSTLLNMIAGLIKPDRGSITLNSNILDNVLPEKRRIAMMFQDFALLPHLNVWQNVAFGLKLRGTPHQVAREIAVNLLREVGLAGMAERRVQNLSGGEQQRTALARALAVSPELLLLDEPFSGIDSALRGQLQNLVLQVVQKRDVPALMVTHDPAEACLMANQIVLLSAGKVLQSGTPDELLHRPVSAEAARLMGCLNVCETHYVPQHAIHIHHKQGEMCRLISVFRQPLFERVVFWHSQYGELLYLNSDQDMSWHESFCVWIDETAIVRFKIQ